MAPVVKTAWLADAVARLTGDTGRPCNEGRRYRISLTTADKQKHSVSVQVDTHPTDSRPYAIPQLAKALKLDVDQMMEALHGWTHDQMRTHLQQFNKADLMPPTFRR